MVVQADLKAIVIAEIILINKLQKIIQLFSSNISVYMYFIHKSINT